MKKWLPFFVATFLTCFVPAQAENSYEELIKMRLISQGEKPALHLGCGEVRLPGYINIDFPREKRELHTRYAADYYSDLRTLQFPENSVKKIENHHVFEHFPKAQSLALLCAWHLWLVDEGVLVIETPDFAGGINRYINSTSFKEKQVILRHLFGSHEADWAVHWDGWSLDKFTYLLTALGFELQSSRFFSWASTDNIEVTAKKIQQHSHFELRTIAKELLKLGLVDSSEQALYKKWCQDFDEALDLMIISDKPK